MRDWGNNRGLLRTLPFLSGFSLTLHRGRRRRRRLLLLLLLLLLLPRRVLAFWFRLAGFRRWSLALLLLGVLPLAVLLRPSRRRLARGPASLSFVLLFLFFRRVLRQKGGSCPER